MIEMYLAGVSVRRVEDITEALWGTKVSAGTVSYLNQKVYGHIETWRNWPLQGQYPYVYVDGIYLKRNWGGTYENVAILIAMAVNEEGFREVIGASEGNEREAFRLAGVPEKPQAEGACRHAAIHRRQMPGGCWKLLMKPFPMPGSSAARSLLQERVFRYAQVKDERSGRNAQGYSCPGE